MKVVWEVAAVRWCLTRQSSEGGVLLYCSQLVDLEMGEVTQDLFEVL
jgi:hypothetical protein